MKKSLLLFCIAQSLLLYSDKSFAQLQPCGTDEFINEEIDKNPALLQKRNEIELSLENYMKENPPSQINGACTIYIIPTVIHKENTLSTYDVATAQSMVDDLTLYFRKRSPFYSNNSL